MKFVFALLFLIFASPLAQAKAGTDHSGGGAGQACFATREEAQRAYDPVQKIIRPEARSKILSVWTLELFESSIWNQAVDPAVTQDQPRTYLNGIIKSKIEPLNPTFATYLDRALDLIESLP